MLFLISLLFLWAKCRDLKWLSAPTAVSEAVEVPFDSFATPDVAGSVLCKEAKKLQAEYVDFWVKRGPGVLSDIGISRDSEQAQRGRAGRAAMIQSEAVDYWIQRYRHGIASLRQEANAQMLERNLLFHCERFQRWAEWMDVYLGLLRRNPNHPVILNQGERALSLAQAPEQRAEIVATLELLRDFGLSRETKELAKEILERWSRRGRYASPPESLPES